MSSKDPTIQTEVQVMYYDTDAGGVVHNLAYLRFIEMARTLFAEKLGMDFVAMSQMGQHAVVVQIEVQYKRPAVLWDKLVVHGRLESVERSRFWCSFQIIRPSDGMVMVESRQMLAIVQMPAGKPLRLPAEWATRYAHLRKA